MVTENEKLEAVKRAVGQNDIEFIGIDDSFGFKCQQCGQCCINRGDIIINPFDVYNGAKYLGISTTEFLTKYTNIQLGGHSKIPIVLLASNKNNGFCPLLKFDIKDGGKFKCMIHPAKPGACANHPIGVAWSKNVKTGEVEESYIKVSQCQNSISDEMHTVREWTQAQRNNAKEVELAHEMQTIVTSYFNPRAFWLLTDIMEDIIQEHEDEFAKSVTSIVPNELMQELQRAYVQRTIELIYGDYDTDKPFLEQAKERLAMLDEFYTETKKVYEALQEPMKKAYGKDFDTLLKENEEKHS